MLRTFIRIYDGLAGQGYTLRLFILLIELLFFSIIDMEAVNRNALIEMVILTEITVNNDSLLMG